MVLQKSLFLSFLPDIYTGQQGDEEEVLEYQMFHIGKKNGRKYIIVPIPLGLPQ